MYIGSFSLLNTFLSLTCRSDTQPGGDAGKESTEEPQDLPGAMKTRTLLDYSTYMTQLVGSESCNPTPSPCHSDKGSPTMHKKVNQQQPLGPASCLGTWQQRL